MKIVDKTNVIQELIHAVEDRAKGKTVADVRVGLCYTAVLLDEGGLGLAYTFPQQYESPCCTSPWPGSLRGKPASEIIYQALSDSLLSSSLGIATINALANEKTNNAFYGDILDIITFEKSDTVGMVGFFAPLVDTIKSSVKKLYIVERKELTTLPDVYPPDQIPTILPACDIIIITATTLINKTFESILQHSPNAREKIILGATTPLLPQVFSSRGITMLSGIKILHKEKVLQVVSEGGGMKNFKNLVQKVNIPLKSV